MLQKLQELNTGQRLWSIDWHPEGNLIASVGESRILKLWKRDINQKWYLLNSIPTDHTKSLRCVKFSHNGKSIAIASFDSTITIYILAQEGYEFLSQLQGHENEVKCVDWSPEDNKLVTCSRDKNVWIWSFNSSIYEYECENVLQGHTEDVKHVIWLDETSIASASYDNTIRIWNQNDDDFECTQILQAHISIVWSLVFDTSANILYSCGEDTQIIAWIRKSQSLKFQLAFVIQNIHIYPVYSLSVLNQQYLVSGSGDNSVALVTIKEGKTQKMLRDRQYAGADVNCVRCYDKKGQLLVACCGDDQKILIWSLKNN